MGILNRLLQVGRGDGEPDERVGAAVERIVGLSPQLRLARRYQARLGPAVATALKYVGELVASIPATREASAAAWATDPYLHAFFAAAGDIAQALSRSPELRAYFERNPDAAEAYGVLGMTMTERQVLGMAQQGETLRRDVAQTTVSFSAHRVRICAPTEADLRQEIVARGVEQLGLEGLARIAADKSRRGFLEQERALIKARVQLLERQGAGMRSVLGSGAPAETEELGHLQGQMEENERSLQGLGLRTAAVDREIDQLCNLLADPSPHLYVDSKRLRLDRMNVVQPDDGTQGGEEFTFQVASIPGTTPPEVRAFALVRFARGELLPAANLLDQAARHLLV